MKQRMSTEHQSRAIHRALLKLEMQALGNRIYAPYGVRAEGRIGLSGPSTELAAVVA